MGGNFFAARMIPPTNLPSGGRKPVYRRPDGSPAFQCSLASQGIRKKSGFASRPLLISEDRFLVRARRARVGVTAHVEVVVVDIENLNSFFVFQSVRNRPAIDVPFFKVNGALVMSVV
jgi:hypothetical protein